MTYEHEHAEPVNMASPDPTVDPLVVHDTVTVDGLASDDAAVVSITVDLTALGAARPVVGIGSAKRHPNDPPSGRVGATVALVRALENAAAALAPLADELVDQNVWQRTQVWHTHMPGPGTPRMERHRHCIEPGTETTHVHNDAGSVVEVGRRVPAPWANGGPHDRPAVLR